MAIFAAATSRAAEEHMPLGAGHILVRVDIIDYTDETIERSGDLDRGALLGVGAYLLASRNIYIGGELGYASTEGDRPGGGQSELRYVPLELNIKYAVFVFPDTVVDIGGGFSLNYVDEESISGTSSNLDDWVVGGQVFASINRLAGNFFIGIEGRYQGTEHFKGDTLSNATYDLTNWRLGARAGMHF